ncbi:MAG: sensor histidine kinase [Bacillota bacterium]
MQYLSTRVAILFGAVTCIVVVLLFALLGPVAYLKIIVTIAVVCLVACLFLFWRFVYRPFQKAEEITERCFTVHHKYEGDFCPISPTNIRLLERLWEMQNPSQIFEMNKRQAQYLALQNQINPHFLYNTLESIRSEALVCDIESIADMTEALATFFRYTISKVENLVSVEEELENCAVYFQIQQYRFGERLNLSTVYDFIDKDEIFRCRLPKLSLQPLLENAIIHGTELKLEPGNLTIALELSPKRLLIRISDDGVGMDDATLAKLNGKFGRQSTMPSPAEERRGGLALVNVDERIRLLFGEEYGLHVFSHLGLGTDVEVHLPVVTSDRDVKNREVLL